MIASVLRISPGNMQRGALLVVHEVAGQREHIVEVGSFNASPVLQG